MIAFILEETKTETKREGLSLKETQKNGKQTFEQQKNKEKRNLKKADAKKITAKKAHSSQKADKALCPTEKRCGSCQYLHLSYEQQLKIKEETLKELLKGICPLKGMLGMKYPYHYRNKVHSVFGCDRKGRPVSGIYEEGTHRIVPVENCLIEDQKADEILETIRQLLPGFKIRHYDEDTGYGLLRHVLIKRGFATNQIMVVLVTASPVFPSKNNFVKALLSRHPEITTVIQNVNGRGTSMVLGEKERVLYGPGYIEDRLCGCTFRISSKSFYQVNPVQTEILYKKAMELAKLTGKETLIDAYCGIGTIGIIGSKQAKKVIGVELNSDAVRDAIKNAKRNEVKNIYFYCSDAGTFMVKMAKEKQSADVVIMDPPRSGSTREFMDSIAVLSPDRVIYVSCGPDTLARDLRYLKTLGYEAKEAWGVDLFPWTKHIETVVKLVRKTPDAYIDLTVDMDELDLTASEAKATYQEIKEYIKEKYDVKVSSLYIAQVKQKHGIIERENYNTAKSENAKQPQCPPEKEKLIEEALRHFKMI